MPNSTLSVIKDPITGNSYARDTSVAGSTYAAYTPPAAAAPATSSDSSSTKVARYPSAGVSSSSKVDDDENDYQNASKQESYNDIEQRILGSYSSEIAAIKAAEAAALTAQAPINAQAEGRTRASSAASGTLGTDFGNSQQGAAEKTSSDNNNKIVSDYETKINDLQNQAAQQAESEYSGERSSAQQAAKDKITYDQQQQATTQSKIQQIAAATSLDDLSQDEYDSLYANSGFSSGDEFNAYYNAARQAAIQGTKLVGDSTTGWYVPQIDSNGNLTYKNVIKPIVKPTATGAYQFDPDTGEVKTIAGAQNKIITSGGRIWSIDPTTNKATALTSRVATAADGKVGYQKATVDQQLAVHAWIESQPGSDAQKQQALANVQSSPDYFMTALNGALQSGIYVPAAVSSDSSDDAASADAEQAAQDAEDAADNLQNDQDSGGEGAD